MSAHAWADDHGNGGVAGSTLTALMSTHPHSPLQGDYSERTLGKYRDHAAKFTEGVMAYGTTLPNTSKDIAKGANPLPVGESEWYGVGGATDSRTGTKVPEKARSLSRSQFGANDALEHVLDVEGHNIDRAAKGQRPVFAGGWNERTPSGGQQAVMDHSTVHASEANARTQTRQRGERAYFDAKNVQSKDADGRPVD